MYILEKVSLVKAIDIAGRVTENFKVAEISEQLKQSIEVGNPVARSLKDHEVFPPMVVQLAASG